MPETLNQTLRRLGYATRPGRHGRKHIVAADRPLFAGEVLFSGTAGEVWAWLRERGEVSDG